jgi:hypothetical protein
LVFFFFSFFHLGKKISDVSTEKIILEKRYIRQGVEELEGRNHRLALIEEKVNNKKSKIVELEVQEKDLEKEEERVRKDRRYESNMKGM